jgi:hypothetical protein
MAGGERGERERRALAGEHAPHDAGTRDRLVERIECSAFHRPPRSPGGPRRGTVQQFGDHPIHGGSSLELVAAEVVPAIADLDPGPPVATAT